MNQCLCCRRTGLRKLLDLGDQPAANRLRDHVNDVAPVLKLALLGCEHCGHMQQEAFYPERELFDHYFYASSTSQTLRNYFDWMAKTIRSDFQANPPRLLEIASNDGGFLRSLQRVGIDPEGIDPARNIVESAKRDGLNVVAGYFPQDHPGGDYDVIVAMNVIAHTSAPEAIIKGVAERLASGGFAWIQTSQADMLVNGEFDTLYHEHYGFFSPESMHQLAKQHKLKVTQIFKSAIHGNSYVFIVRHDDCIGNPLQITDRTFLIEELSATTQTDYASAFDAFVEHVEARQRDAQEAIDFVKSRGWEVCLVGVAAKAITQCQFFGITPTYIIDEAPLKIDRFPPGIDVQIQSLDAAKTYAENIVYWIGAWNFFEELHQKLRIRRDLSKTTSFTLLPKKNFRFD